MHVKYLEFNNCGTRLLTHDLQLYIILNVVSYQFFQNITLFEEEQTILLYIYHFTQMLALCIIYVKHLQYNT